MSSRELERVEVMGRVAKHSLKLVHAAEILRMSYRQVKRLCKVYRQGGAAGLKQGMRAGPRIGPNRKSFDARCWA